MTNRNEDLLKSKTAEGLVSSFQNGKKEGITSLELVEQINLFREQEKGSGFTPLLHKSLLGVIRDEFDEEINEQKNFARYLQGQKGRKQSYVFINFQSS